MMDPLAFRPEIGSPFPESFFKNINSCFTYLLNGMDAHCFQYKFSLFTYPGNISNRHRRQEFFFFTNRYLKKSIWLCLVGGHLCNHFITGQPERNGEFSFINYLLTQINCPLQWIKEFFHAGEVEIKFIYRSFFKKRRLRCYDLSHPS